MIKKHKIFSIFLLAILVFLPVISFAAIVNCSGPDCNFNSLAGMANNFITWFLGISVSVAAVSFAVAGAMMLIDPNNPEKRGQAKKVFFNTAVGLVIVLAAWLIVYTIINTFVDPSIGALRYLNN
jgi:hypothetical protein